MAPKKQRNIEDMGDTVRELNNDRTYKHTDLYRANDNYILHKILKART